MDQILLRPVSVTLQIFGSEIINRCSGRIAQGLLVLGIAFYLVEIRWTTIKRFMLPVVFISLVCFFGGLFVIGATITFRIFESIEVVNILTYGGSEMMSYSMHIYQNWLRQFFTYIIPAIFLVCFPALYILEKPDRLNMPGFSPFLSPLVGFGMLVIAFFGGEFGLRHYQSTGT